MRALSPRAILVIGWLAMMLYAYPGYMSFDSIWQLTEARSGQLGDAHPPMMSALWGAVDRVIAGPFGMLVIQTTGFLAGAHLVLGRMMSARAAAVCACVLLLLPPVAAVMGVIWKDGQMAAALLLGIGLVMSPRRWVRLVALGCFLIATAMRHNALAMTFPLIVLLFTWSPSHRWWARYPIAVVAWVGVTFGAQTLNGALVSSTMRSHLWHDALALYDIVGTLRYADPISDDELRVIFEGVPLIPKENIQEATRRSYRPEDVKERARLAFGAGRYVPQLWTTTYHFIDVPTNMDQRAAVARAWKKLIPAHFGAYLTYRWHVFAELIQIEDEPIPGAAYVWFVDVINPIVAMQRAEHSAAAGGIQDVLRDAMVWLGSSWLFRPWIYIALSLVLLGLAIRDRAMLALIGSGLCSEAVLFILAPTIDYRYSFWLVTTTLLALMIVIARRARGEHFPLRTRAASDDLPPP